MKKFILSVIAIVVCLLSSSFNVSKAEAADVRGIELKNQKDITKYDVTGDGEKDTIRIDCDKPDELNAWMGDDWKITINGEVVYRDNPEDYTETLSVVLYQISSTRIYLDIQENVGANDDINSRAFYQYKDGSLVKVCDIYEPLLKHVYSFHFYVTDVKVTKKKIVASYMNQFSATGYLAWGITYKYQNGSWKKAGNTYKVTEEKALTTNRRFAVYKTAGGKTKAFTLKKGQAVQIKKICLKNKQTYVQLVLPNGKKGWLKSPAKDLPEMYYFQEVMFAG